MAQKTNDEFRDLIAEVIFDHFGDGGDMAIYCSKQTGEMLADDILEQAQERGLEPYFQAPAPCCRQQRDRPSQKDKSMAEAQKSFPIMPDEFQEYHVTRMTDGLILTWRPLRLKG